MKIKNKKDRVLRYILLSTFAFIFVFASLFAVFKFSNKSNNLVVKADSVENVVNQSTYDFIGSNFTSPCRVDVNGVQNWSLGSSSLSISAIDGIVTNIQVRFSSYFLYSQTGINFIDFDVSLNNLDSNYIYSFNGVDYIIPYLITASNIDNGKIVFNEPVKVQMFYQNVSWNSSWGLNSFRYYDSYGNWIGFIFYFDITKFPYGDGNDIVSSDIFWKDRTYYLSSYYADSSIYQEAYNNGFDKGYKVGLNSQYGVFANANITGAFKFSYDGSNYLINESITNDDFVFKNGIIYPNSSFIDKYNSFLNIYRTNSPIPNKTDFPNSVLEAYFNIGGLDFVYNSDIDLNFATFSDYINIGSFNNFYFYADIITKNGLNDNYFLYYYETIDKVTNNESSTIGINFYDLSNLNSLGTSVITNLNVDLLKSVYDKFVDFDVNLEPLTIFDIVPAQNWVFSQNNVAFDLGYENGYADGSTSEIVQNAYDEGYSTGNRVGYQQGLSNGLANANDYSFFGLIGAVIDAPIQYLSSLFNFNILGFNMLAFITSLFTVCFIIWIIKMLLGGK